MCARVCVCMRAHTHTRTRSHTLLTIHTNTNAQAYHMIHTFDPHIFLNFLMNFNKH